MSGIPKATASLIAKTGLFLAALSALAALSSGLGFRYELWDFQTGLKAFRWSAYCALASAVLSLVGIVLSRLSGASRGLFIAAFGLVISVLLLAVPLYWLQKARSLPSIHDISTDTENPPKFVAILPLRKNALNPSEYGGESIAAQQHKAYPDIAPLLLNITPDKAFERANRVATKMGWKIVDASIKEGRIEATATTRWFGFKDDIVIRIENGDGGSRVDIRSVSRVGKSDLGTNANRIRRFLREMEKS